jgi:hypothetical protein
MSKSNKCTFYRFTNEDLIKVLKFTKDYHLEETKQSSGRTNQGSRNFGGELDAFIPGKLIELGVCKILETYGGNKSLLPDYKIYKNTIVAEKVDPDIIGVKEDNEVRYPNIHVEIKRVMDGDVWLGMRADQLNRVATVKGIEALRSMYMIHASLAFDNSNNKKQNDVVGAMLKELIPRENLNLDEFSDFTDLYCKIDYVYSIQDLMSKGHLYKKGDIIPTGEFPEGVAAYKKDGSTRKGYQLIKRITKNRSELPMKIALNGVQPSYGKWEIIGKAELFKTAKNKEVLHCKSATVISNPYFGKFNLAADKTYKFYFENKLGNDYKNIDDYWFFRKRLEEMVSLKEICTNEESIKKIISSI